ncbi:MAG: MarR family transcriptional regulator [Acidimicrobiia bacterium]|nr:MarR family transcriptional regulator [Acidimicrobiia bacterium]MDH3397350.1 MarR family transcriptional regulator [Acidimicrobiia bacterium]
MVDRDERQFTEEMGALFERSGSPRMAGRVWGYLLIVNAEQVSAADLAEALNASPSSISAATRFLLGLGLLDRTRMPGERRDYFTIHHGAILNLVRYRLEALTPKNMAARALEIFGERNVARPHLEELNEVYTWFADEFAALVDRFTRERLSVSPRE